MVLLYAVCLANFVNAACRRDLPQIKYSSQNRELTLSIRTIATLPDNMVFLGGYYTDQDAVYHSALLLSEDGGVTWKNSGFSYSLCQLDYLQTSGKSYIWGLILLTPEGLTTPTLLLRSTDAGETWCSVNLEQMLHDDLSIPSVEQFQFWNENYGLLSIISATQTVTDTLYTRDGGLTWQRLWLARTSPDIEPGSFSLGKITARDSSYAPLWTQNPQYEYYKLTGNIRVRDDSKTGFIIVESYEYAKDDGWRERSRIPKRCLLDGVQLLPLPPQKVLKKGEK